MTGIYGIYNLKTNKWYIGQSTDIAKRWKQHIWALDNGYHYNTKLSRSWKLHGKISFEFIVLEVCEKSELDNREKHWIQYYDSMSNGYNLCEGGNTPTGRIITDEMRLAESLARLGDKNPFYGKTHTERWREQASKRQVGEKNHMFGKRGASHPRSRKVKCIETNTIYNGLAEASRATGVDRNNISSCCSGRLKSAGKLHWEYVS